MLYAHGERFFSVPADASAPPIERLRIPGAKDTMFSAAPQRVAINTTARGRLRLLTGPPLGPFTAPAASPGGSSPWWATVSGDNLFTVEDGDPDGSGQRSVVTEPGKDGRTRRIGVLTAWLGCR